MPPFETYVVKTGSVVPESNPSPEEIADDITQIYERVARAGGKVLAQCVIDRPYRLAAPKSKRPGPSAQHTQSILITAELPEPASETE